MAFLAFLPFAGGLRAGSEVEVEVEVEMEMSSGAAWDSMAGWVCSCCFGFLPRFALGFSSWKVGGGSSNMKTGDSAFGAPSLLLFVPLFVLGSAFGVLLDANDASMAA